MNSQMTTRVTHDPRKYSWSDCAEISNIKTISIYDNCEIEAYLSTDVCCTAGFSETMIISISDHAISYCCHAAGRSYSRSS